MRATAIASILLVANLSVHAQETSDRGLSQIDHVIYATPDLDRTVDDLAKRLGVRAAHAGSSPGRGTRSALLSLGEGVYLEIVAPDRSQPQPVRLPWYLRNLTEPRVVLWAAKGQALESLRAMAVAQDVALGEVASSSRTRPDGVVLTWRFTSPRVSLADGLIPFFIDWGDAPHPSVSSPAGVRLISFRGEHPDVCGVQRMLQKVGLLLPVTQAVRPGLVAVLVGPSGRVELR